jgi:hypothetical protein
LEQVARERQERLDREAARKAAKLRPPIVAAILALAAIAAVCFASPALAELFPYTVESCVRWEHMHQEHFPIDPGNLRTQKEEDAIVAFCNKSVNEHYSPEKIAEREKFEAENWAFVQKREREKQELHNLSFGIFSVFGILATIGLVWLVIHNRRRRLIPLSQVNQYLGLAGQIRNGSGFNFFGRS